MVSGIGAIDDGKVPPPIPETIGKVSELVAHKYHSRHTVFVTTANENPNFQPISFLQSGTQIGRAVCRIVREFSLKDFKEFIKDIQESDDISHFDSVSKLREIFAIPQDISDRLLIPTTLKPYQDSLSKKRQALIEGQSNPEVDVDQKERIKKQLEETDILKQLVDILQRKLEKQDISIDDINAVNKLNQHLFVLLGDLHPSLSTEAKATQAQRFAIELFKAVFIEKFYLSLNEQILALLNPIPLGTGFLVGETYLITNNHVLPDVKTAAQSIAQFNYVEDAAQNTQGTIDINLAPQKFFITNPELDYTLVQLHWDVQERQAGYQFGWIPLVEKDDHATPGLIWVYAQNSEPLNSGQAGTQNGETTHSTQQNLEILSIIQQHLEAEWTLEPGCSILGKRAIAIQYPRGKTQIAIEGNTQLRKLQQDLKAKGYQMVSLPGDPVFIVQHPKGRQKEIVLRDNEIINNGLFETVLRYQANSDYGSSGSPVFNEKWELVALHHAAIASEDTAQVSFQQGIRIHQIIADLKQKRFSNPTLESFLREYVVTTEQLNYPPLPSGLEFDGISAYANASVGIEKTAGTIESAEVFLVTASQDGTIKLWNQTGTEVNTIRIPNSPLLDIGSLTGAPSTDEWRSTVLQGHTGPVSSVTFSPDGQRIVSSSVDNTLRIWDANTRQPIGEPLQMTHQAAEVAFSPDSKRIVSYTDERDVRIWDIDTRQPIGEPFRGHTDFVRSVAFSPDGKRIVTGSRDATLRIWDVDTSQPIGEPLKGHTHWVTSVAFSPDGQRIVSGGGNDGTVRIWNANTGQPIGEPFQDPGSITSVAFSPDGQRIASSNAGSSGGSVHIWNANTDQPIGETLQGHTRWTWSVAFSPDGQRIASGGGDGTVRIWDVNTLQPIGELLQGNTEQIYSVAFSPDSQRIVSGSSDSTVRIWEYQATNAVNSDRLNTYFLAGSKGAIGSFDLSSIEPSINYPQDIRSFFPSLPASFSEASITRLSYIRVLPESDGEAVWAIVTTERQDNIQFTTTLAVASRRRSGFPGYYEPVFQRINVEITAFASERFGASYHMAVADSSGTLEVYSGGSSIRLEGHRAIVTSLTFYAGGDSTSRYLVSGDESGRIILWRKDGTEDSWSMADLNDTYPVAVTNLAANRNFFFISGHADGTLQLWQLNNAASQLQNIATHKAHHTAVNVCHFIERNALVSASDDGTVNLFQVDGTRDREERFSPSGLRLLKSLNHGGSPVSVWVNPDARPYAIPQAYSLKGKPFTIEAWVNPHPNGTGGTLISRLRRSQGRVSGEYVLYLTKEGHIVFSVLNSTAVSSGDRSNISDSAVEWQTKNTLQFGEFSHIAIVCKETQPEETQPEEVQSKWTLTIYINGQEAEIRGEDADRANWQNDMDTDQETPLLFGAFFGKLEVTSHSTSSTSFDRTDFSNQTGFFRGMMAEVRLWNQARSLDAIQSHMHRRLNTVQEAANGLVGYWRFEEGRGNRIYNHVQISSPTADGDMQQGLGYGVMEGAKWISVYSPALPLPFGLMFDGNDDVVNVEHCQTITLSQGITVEAWVKHGSGDGLIVHSCGSWKKGQEKWENSGFSLSCYQGRLRLDLQPEALEQRATFDAQDHFPQDGLWHHIAFTLQPAKGNQEDKTPDEQDNAFTVELYLDGKRQNIVPIQGLSSSLLVGGQYRSRGTFSGFIESPTQSLSIGGPGPNSAQAPWNLYFNGAIAEVRLWHRAKTQSEIRSAMNNRLRGNEPGLIGYWRLDTLIQVNGQLRLHNAAIVEGETLSASHGLASSQKSQSQPGFFPISTNFPVDTVGHWATDFVQEMVDKRLMEEFWSRDRITSDRFQPNQPVLAAEFSRIVNDTFGIDLHVAEQPFTRVQAIHHLVQGLQLKADDMTAAGVTQFLRGIYKEADQIHEADRMAVAIATANRLIVNAPPPKTAQETTTNTQPEISPQLSSLTALRPTDNLTRAELAALISRALVAVGQARETQPSLVVEPHWAAVFVANLKHYINQDPMKPDPAFNNFKFNDPVRPEDYEALFKAAFKQESNARFNAQKALTRLEAIAALVKDLNLKPRYLNLSKVYESDEAMADPAYLDALRTATAQKMVVNYPNVKELRSQATLTKAELGALIYQALVAKRASGILPISSPYIVIPPDDAALERFSDVPSNHWAADFINATANLGFDGITQTTFQPNAPISAKDYALITARCLESLSPTRDEDAEISAAVLTAYELESILADFREIGHPDRPIKRQEAIYHLVKHLQLSAKPFNLATVYQDGHQVAPGGLQEAIATATANELLINYPDARRLNPTRAITRAELATLLYQSLVAIGQMPKIASPYLATALGFTDIEGHWAREKILYLVGRNIVKGFPDSTFRPNANLLRAEFAALLVKAFNPTVPEESNSTAFNDVPSNFWAQNAIRQAYESSLMIGLPDNQFGPELPVTRLQAAIVLVNCLIKQEKAPPIDPAILKLVTDNYTDIQALNPANKRLMIQRGLAIAVQVGIIARPTTRSQFRPDAAATRAEVVGMVAAALQSSELGVG